MKKFSAVLALVTFALVLSGCSKDLSLTLIDEENENVIIREDVDKNTVLMRQDDSLQVALVDEFDQEYYDINELTSFINEEISNYNSKNGENAVTFDAIDKRADKVVIIQSYSKVEHYAAFNNLEANLIYAIDAREESESLPEVFNKLKGGTISTKEALKKDKYKLLSIKEDTDIIVDGKIMYYFNGELTDTSTIKASAEEETFLIYKKKFFN